MKRVLLYRGAHVERPMIWDASTDFLKNAAYVSLFKFFDEHGLYANEDTVTGALIGMARMGNPDACAALLAWRRTWSETQYDFEFIELEESPEEPIVDDFVITEEMMENAIRDRANGGIE